MPRSHHRKKHKSHVKQFKESHDTTVSANAKGKAAWIFSIAAAAAGFAITFFASGGAWLWIAIFTAGCGAAGYYFGKKMDQEKENK